MKTQQGWSTGIRRTALGPLLVLAFSLPVVAAEAESRQQPGALLQAERALERGEPEQALNYLHRQRALLRHSRFRAQRDALTCQAYIQQQDLQRAARVCDEAYAFDGEIPGVGVYKQASN